MNKFLSCVQKGRGIEVYYKEFVKLSCHAPHMIEDQKLKCFILGLKGQLAKDVNTPCPTFLVDALIRSKANMANLSVVSKSKICPSHPQDLFVPRR